MTSGLKQDRETGGGGGGGGGGDAVCSALLSILGWLLTVIVTLLSSVDALGDGPDGLPRA